MEMEMENMSVLELRKLAREKLGGQAWIASANKAALIAALTGNSNQEEAAETKTEEKSNSKSASSDEASALSDALIAIIKKQSESMSKDEITRHINAVAKNLIDKGREEIEQKVKVLLEGIPAKEIIIKEQGKTDKKFSGMRHAAFEEVYKTIRFSKDKTVCLVGTCGSGKTKLMEQIAEALEVEFFSESVCQQTSKSALFGMVNATGSYNGTQFRQSYDEAEKGGLFLLDEADNGNPNVLNALNSAVANGHCGFPDCKRVKRHARNYIAMAMNTYGLGADRQFVGRVQQDAATLDRFPMVSVDIDDKLEDSLCLEYSVPSEWKRYIRAVRAVAGKYRVIVSPRATLNGGLLLNSGLTREQVEKSCLWKGTDKVTIDKIKAEAGV